MTGRSHGLLRLSEKIFNTPQLMTQDAFERLTDFVTDRNTGSLSWQVDVGKKVKLGDDEDEENGEGKILSLNPLKATSFKRPDFSTIPEEDRARAEQEYFEFIQYDPTMKLGVLNVEGTTVYRSTPFESMCGMTSYQRLERTMKAQLFEGAKTILLYVDSGGGEAYGMVETAGSLRALADKSGAKVISYVDGDSCSAAYGLSAIAHEVVANPSSRVGSIGVVVSLMNNSKQLEKDGLERIYLYKGDNKVALDSEGKFSESFLKSVDDLITTTYQSFTSHIAAYRPMTQQQVIDTQASVYTADDALQIGLVDKLLTRSEFFGSYLPQLSVGGIVNPQYQMVAKAIPLDEVNTKMDIEDIKNQANKAATPEAKVDEGQVAELQASITTLTESQTELQGLVEALTTQNTEAQALLLSKESLITELTASAESAKLELENFKQEALVNSRKAKLSTVMASDKVEANLCFAQKLSEEDFTSYMDTLTGIYQNSKTSMAEIGAKGDDQEPAKDFDSIIKSKVNEANASRA